MRWEGWGILGLGLLGLLTWKYSGRRYFEVMGSALGMRSSRPAQIVFLVASVIFTTFGLLTWAGLIHLRG